MTTFLSIDGLHVTYGSTNVLRGVNLEVGEAGFTAIVGPSGCGKTTLLRTIAGLERAVSGDMRLGKKMLTTHGIHLAPHKRNIGWVPQDAALFPHLTVAENISFGLARTLRGTRKAAHHDRVRDLLSLVALTPFAQRMPHELSGGQAQRVALARALANNPTLVLLDEPFAGLDPVLRSDLRSEVREILATANTAALLVTHDQTEALSLASRVALMHDGIIEQTGSPFDVYFQPSTLWCAEFLGAANVLHGTVLSRSNISDADPTLLTSASTLLVNTALGDVSATWMESTSTPDDGRLLPLMIRPEGLGLSAGNGWRVVDTSFAGHDGLVTLTQVASPSPASATASDFRDGSQNPLATASTPRVKVLVSARDMPALGALYDVIVTGPALAYRPLG